MNVELEKGLPGVTLAEEKSFNLPHYRRNGLIPGWSEVFVKFRLGETFEPKDRRLLMGFYRAQRRIAEGRNRRAARIIKALERNINYKRLEENAGSVLTEIATFVRGPSERRRAK